MWVMKQFNSHFNGDIETFKRYINTLTKNDYFVRNGSNIGMLTAINDKMIKMNLNTDILNPKKCIPDDQQKEMWIKEDKNITNNNWRSIRETLIKECSVSQWKNWFSHLQFKNINSNNEIIFYVKNKFIARELSNENNIYYQHIINALHKNRLNTFKILVKICH